MSDIVIDNFDIFRSHLDFKEKTDRYIVHILCRPKDIPADKRVLGSNEHQRLIRTYYIDSLEYFDRKTEAIKTLCVQNNARAYIIPQVRNNYECLLNLGEKVLEAIRLGNSSVKPEHLLRSAYCEYHKSRDKKWILDLDKDCMTEYIPNCNNTVLGKREWTVDEVLKLVQENLVKCGKKAEDSYVVPTKSGHHIVTSPFDLQTAFRQCSMLYEGEKRHTLVGFKDTGPGEYVPIHRNVVGWLHKDGMSLLYLNLK